jgi:hypothetical protein
MRSRPGPVLYLALIAGAFPACSGGDGGTTLDDGVASIEVQLDAPTAQVGEVIQATAIPKDAQGSPIAGRTATWESSNVAVASVSNAGVVRAVGVGVTEVTATVDGLTGRSGFTVTEARADIDGLTLKRADGQLLNLSNVGGTIAVSLDVLLPPGASGEVAVGIDDVEFARRRVNAAPASVGPAANLVMLPLDVLINTAEVDWSWLNDHLAANPKVLNGQHRLWAWSSVDGQSVKSEEIEQTIMVNNPLTFVGYVRGAPVQLSPVGTTWFGGDASITLQPVSFGEPVVPRDITICVWPEVLPAPVSCAIDAVITVDLGLPLPIPGMESGASGSRFSIHSFTTGGVVVRPADSELNNNGNCVYTNGTGFLMPFPLPPPPFPTGCINWVAPNLPPTSIIPNGAVLMPNPVWIDNLPPRVTDVSYPEQPTEVGMPSRLPDGTRGTTGGWFNPAAILAPQVTFEDVNSASATISLHLGTDPGFIPTNANRVTTASEVPETVQRSLWGKVVVTDGVGNSSLPHVMLGTNTAPSPVGVTTNGGTASVLGPGLRTVVCPAGEITATACQDLQFNNATFIALSGSGSPAGYGPNPVEGLSYRNFDPAQAVLGLPGAPVILPGTGGNSFNSSIPLSALIGTNPMDGYYTASVEAVDAAGNAPAGGSYSASFLLDVTAPAVGPIVLPPTATSGAEIPIAVSATDNVDLSRIFQGWTLGLSDPRFASGFFTVPLAHQVIGPGFDPAAIKTSADLNLTTPVPDVFVVPPSLQLVPAAPTPLTGAMFDAEDVGRNRSEVRTAMFASPVASQATSPISRTGMTPGASQLCRGVCPGGPATTMPMFAFWIAATSVSPIAEFIFYLLDPDGRLHEMGKGGTPTTSTVASGTMFRVETTFDGRDFCGRAGTNTIVGIAWDQAHRTAHFVEALGKLEIVQPATPSSNCFIAR